ncbi:MAG: cytidylate kinase-like family protein [Muribaculaceae bacterium]|nr:cytidylate kinase-like family protein [Muribaculaceae bacterium]
MENYVITIGRRFGSGGRELGQLLAKRLGISYYDKELLFEAARKAGLSPEFFEQNDERFPRFLNGLFTFAQGYATGAAYTGASPISSDGVYHNLAQFMRETAEKESCIFVGRTADFVLREHPRCVNIFVHAPMEHCVKRIVSRCDVKSEDKARSLAEKTNKLRAAYYNFFTDKRWGDSASYDLTIDTSIMPMDKIADTVIDYLRHRGIL